MQKHTFKISDESINSHGFWVKNEGIDTKMFMTNPVMLYNHDSWDMPIGTWENVRVENEGLFADAVFDLEDEKGKEIARKVDKGIIRGCSMGIRVIDQSRDEGLIKEGQTRSTVTRCELREISITPFPSNANALKLHYEGKDICLSKAGKAIDNIIPQLKPKFSMKKVALKLGLAESASEDDVLAAIDSLKTDLAAHQADKATAFEQLGRATGAITDENKDRMLKLAQQDYSLALSFAGEKKEPGKKEGAKETSDLRLSEVLEALKGKQGKEEAEKDYDWYQRNDPALLSKMKSDEPEKFNKLFNDYIEKA